MLVLCNILCQTVLLLMYRNLLIFWMSWCFCSCIWFSHLVPDWLISVAAVAAAVAGWPSAVHSTKAVWVTHCGRTDCFLCHGPHWLPCHPQPWAVRETAGRLCVCVSVCVCGCLCGVCVWGCVCVACMHVHVIVFVIVAVHIYIYICSHAWVCMYNGQLFLVCVFVCVCVCSGSHACV